MPLLEDIKGVLSFAAFRPDPDDAEISWARRFNARDPAGLPRRLYLQATLPAVYSWGVAWRGIDRLTLAADLRYFDYKRTSLFGTPGDDAMELLVVVENARSRNRIDVRGQCERRTAVESELLCGLAGLGRAQDIGDVFELVQIVGL